MFCECGCGTVTNVADRNYKKDNLLKGAHHRFVSGHQARKSLADQLVSRSVRDSLTGCLEWTGSLSVGGYARLSYRGPNLTVHRVVWFLHFGLIPIGTFVCHRCDNRRCIEIKHLFLGSHSDNMRDMSGKDRSLFGEMNRGAKISAMAARVVLRLSEFSDLSQREIGEPFLLSQQQVSNIARRANWKRTLTDTQIRVAS